MFTKYTNTIIGLQSMRLESAFLEMIALWPPQWKIQNIDKVGSD